MSDEEFMFDDGDDGDYDFEYEENSESGEMSLETKYYNAKTQREDDLSVALSEFAQIVEEDEQEGASEWGFKATKQTLKIQLRQSANKQIEQRQILDTYDRMLVYISKSIVARNYAEKSINNMLERVSLGMDSAFTREFYEKTLVVLKQTRNDRLWLRTSLRLGKLLLDQRDFDKLSGLLDELKRSCLDDAGNVILERGTQLLEVNAMLLGMYVELEDARRLKNVYLESVGVRSAIPHPRIMGFIRECGGKMYMAERNWENAQSNFFDAFKNYDEAGSPQRVQMLKYLVLASMLSESEVNPLSSPEARSYEADPEIIAMTKLVRAYEKQQVNEFERVLEDHSDAILGDRFIARFVDDLRRTFRMLTLQSIVAPYTRVRISSLAQRLRVDVAEAEELLVALILDKRLRASIDQENAILLLQQETTDESQYDAVSSWASGLESMMKQALSVLS